jgi:Concanavalin A-like lectin/glucanases superfamily
MSLFIPYRYQTRNDTAAALAALNEVLLVSEICIEIDTGKGKIGDGVSTWLMLPYQDTTLFAVASGTDTLTATFASKPVLYNGLELHVRAAAANTSAVTFNPNSLGAAPVTKNGGQALIAFDIAGSAHDLVLRYNSVTPRWELLNPATSSPAPPLIIIDATTARVASIGDANNIIEFTNAGNITYTINTGIFPVGTILYALQGNTGQITLVPGAGITFETSDSYKSRTQESFIAMSQTALNKWQALGDIEVVVPGNSVIGKSTTGSGPTSFITASVDDQVLTRRSGSVVFSALTQSDITNLATDLSAKASIVQVQQNSTKFALAAGTADAITAALIPTPTLFDGMEFCIRASAANTITNPTFNPNSLGALTIYKTGGLALSVGDIVGDGHEIILRYRSSPARYELLNPGLAATSYTSPLTTKGDVFTRSASVDSRLPVGADGEIITADSTQSLGIKWAAPAQPAIQFKDEGSNIGTSGGATVVDFTGPGVTASHSTGTITVNIAGGGGSGDSISFSVSQTAHGFSEGMPIYFNGTVWAQSDRDSATAMCDGIVSAVAAGTGSTSPDANCLLLLHLDGTDGATTTTDSSSLSRTATFTGAAAISTTQKKFGVSSLGILSGTSYISFPNTGSSNDFGSSNLTVELQGWKTSLSANEHIFAMTDNTGNDEFRIVIGATGQVTWLWYHSAAYQVNINSGATLLSVGSFYSICVERYGNIHNLLINGVIVATTTISHTQPTNAGRILYLGRLGTTGSTDYRGYIDEVRVSNISRYSGSAYTPAVVEFYGAEPSASFTYLQAGKLTLTTGQWDARTGDAGGLTPGEFYWLSSTTGGITKTAPTTGYKQVVLKAISTTVAIVMVGEVFELASDNSNLLYDMRDTWLLG